MTKKDRKKKINKRLVLNKFFLSLLGMKSFDDIQSKFKDISLEKFDSLESSGFVSEIENKYREDIKLDILKVKEYDQNILKHLENINTNKEIKIKLKYFQYFILLFVEIYLDKYFSDKELFINELNNYLKLFNETEDDNLSDFTTRDINKIAIWSATGSGKTLIMHINFLQIKDYMNKYKINFEEKILLLTPNEGLSRQHLEEFEINGIEASIFSKSANTQLNMNDIKIIEITKLAEKNGEKTVSISNFGTKNIVFIDEGHRGTSGESWLTYRNKLCENGFSIEYSATFGQAISASNNKKLEEEYAKCILFDYSYKYFYKDGYGKDFKILNIKIDIDNKIPDEKNIYLIAYLLTYYQQKKVYKDKLKDFKPFNIENPLMIFIGGSVNALRKENKEEVSDVLDIIKFINYFTQNRNKSINFIDRILKGTTGFLNSANEDVFIKDFDYLTELKLTAVEIYDDILNEIFHETVSGSLLYLEHLKGTDGEIRLRLGDNKPFGLINIGDAEKFIKLCSSNNIKTLSINFSDSLFDTINDKNSDINLLIGSKKFIEGWNSWRVSAIGLMNIGKKEGSQIIQLFGRGVRLKGKNYSLKRSSAYFLDFPFENKDIYIDLKYLETINIFGIKADYMQQFKEILESEEIEKNKKFILNIPVLYNIPLKKIINLKIKNNLDFKKDGNFFSIIDRDEKFIIELDCYEKIQFTSSKEIRSEDIVSKKSQKFSKLHLFLLDYDKIFFELQKYKMAKKYYNISLEKKDIISLFNNSDWYKILIPEEDMKIESIKDIEKFNKIAILLLKKYIDKKYYVFKNRWEDPLLEYQFFDSSIDENQNYLIEIDNIDNNKVYKIFFEELVKKINECRVENNLIDIREIKGSVGYSIINFSLSNPYIYKESKLEDIKIRPIALNTSEWKFVNDFKKYLDNNQNKYKELEIFIIRNISKKGIGFFENNGFFPDFIVWIISNTETIMAFIDPHGMSRETINSEKINLYKKIKEYEKKIDNTKIDIKKPRLESFILSYTEYKNINSNLSKDEWEKNHVLFMNDSDYIKKLLNKILNIEV